jgi:hypothetical protein
MKGIYYTLLWEMEYNISVIPSENSQVPNIVHQNLHGQPIYITRVQQCSIDCRTSHIYNTQILTPQLGTPHG